jgi:deoxyribonuclease V
MVDFDKLKEEQIKLAKKVIVNDKTRKISIVAGADQSYVKGRIISSIAVCDYKSLDLIEIKYAVAEEEIPYRSGFLFYRDGRAVIEAFNKLENKPDVLILACNGILHPRRIGMASQIGILLDVATIGISKKLMLGDVKGSTIYVDKEARGYELQTREHANPVYVSPGYNVSLKTSLEIVKRCLREPHKMPIPLHIAHKNSVKLKKKLA